MAGTNFRNGLGIGPKGQGTILTKVVKGSVKVTVAELEAADEADVTLTVSGAEAGDVVVLTPAKDSMEEGLAVSGCWVSDDNEVTVRLVNHSAQKLTGSAEDWDYLLIKS